MPYIISLLLTLFCVSIYAQEIAPEPATEMVTKKAVTSQKTMVVTANPYATDAAYQILKMGGNAIDAAIAAQMVLGVVEPQSSGLGGGGFMLYYDANSNTLRSYDGRETAPASAQADDFMKNGTPVPFMQAVKSETAVGVPGLVAMLGMAHDNHGTLPWGLAVQPSFQLARMGFKASPRLHKNTAYAAEFSVSDAFKALYFVEGKPIEVGETLRNIKQAEYLRKIADQGWKAFYKGSLALENQLNWVPNRIAYDDLSDYTAIERKPLCGSYRDYKICSMAPPSSSGSTILQTLKLLEPFALNSPYSAENMHLILEAQKLAFADRNQYIADPDFVEVPIEAMLDTDYLNIRRALINLKQSSLAPYPAGNFLEYAEDNSYDAPSTTHISIVDASGNAVSLTSSVEHSFGSSIVSEPHGIVLNNQLTDFSFTAEIDGKKVANRMEAYKRPRSSMSPTMVFDKNDKLIMVVGSPGGSSIIGYVLKTIIAVLDWKLPLQDAITRPHFLHKNAEMAVVEEGLPHQSKLKDLGHRLENQPLTSGVHAIMIKDDGSLIGAADPRREGTARGG